MKVKELFNAIRAGDLGKVKRLLQPGFDVQTQNNVNMSPLNEAARLGKDGFAFSKVWWG